MQSQISSGTIYAPNWQTVRVAKLAARMYAPLGTRMTLGDHVRVTRLFADTFSGTTPDHKWEERTEDAVEWRSDEGSTDEGASQDRLAFSVPPDILQRRQKLAKDLGVCTVLDLRSYFHLSLQRNTKIF
jgi:glycerol-3-phosphate O-acyltransferase / dihydroxyacetone phosphate acyltransferase